jgi:hypothetical protein
MAHARPQLSRDPLGGGAESELNWEAVGAIGEIVSAVAVLITLVYLAIQIRQNSNQIAANTRVGRLAAREVTQQAFSRFRTLVASPDLAELYLKGCADYQALPLADRLRFSVVLQELFLAFDLLHQRYTEGLYEEDLWGRQMPVILNTLVQPGARQWWDRNNQILRSVFVAEVEHVLANTPQARSSAAQQGIIRKPRPCAEREVLGRRGARRWRSPPLGRCSG